MEHPRDTTRQDADAAHIYADCQGELLRHLQRVVGDRASAEDLSQEAGVRWLSAMRSEEVQNPRALLFHIATNLARDQLRRRVVAENHAQSIMDTEVGIGADQVASAREEVGRVSKALATLTPRAREVLLLARVEGCTQKEIAGRLGVKAKTVENHLTRALAQLAASLRGGGRQ
jgi:RNA polymerase sigma-70 factor (ECF subfamily)